MARFRANYFCQKRGAVAVFRLIPSKILTCADLGLPEAVRKLACLRKGLFFDEICRPERDTRFFMGTVLPYNTWLVLGVFWPPKGWQPPLL